MSETSLCTQCSAHPPMFEYEGGHKLCVDCNAKVMAAERDRQSMLATASDHNARMINFLMGQMESTTGLHGLYPRIQVPDPAPVVQTGPVSLHNINVDNSVVGAINTGTIQQLDVSISDIRATGEDGLAEAIKVFTATVLAPTVEIEVENRQQILEEMTFLTEEIKRPSQERKIGLARMIMSHLKESASTVTELSVAWSHLEPLLSSMF